MSMNIGSMLVSKLGSQNSKVPLAAKDIFNSVGYTYFSYDAGGKVEGKDRLIDEFGTELIWLFGIPTYNKILDNTLFKLAKISPEVDVRVLKNKDYYTAALQNAPTEKISQEISKAAQNLPKTKALTFLKFALSLGMTLASYSLLTKFKQSMTKKEIEKEFLAKNEKDTKPEQNSFKQEVSPVFQDIYNFNKSKNNKTVSFGSSALINMAEEFMLNPVKNMIVLDAGISSSRILSARTEGELKEYGIKEGSFLFFVYCAGKLITKGIDKAAEKFLNTPIALDAKFISSKSAEDLLKNDSMKQELSNFINMMKNSSNSAEIYDFIFKNQNNIVVDAAKKSGIISTVKDAAGKSKIDTRKFIDLKEIQKLTGNLNTFIEKAANKNISSYMNKIKGLKVLSTLLNVGACCFALGYIVPKYMYKFRSEHQNGNSEFHVKAQYEKELAEKQAKAS